MKKSIEVCLSTQLIDLYNLENKYVVIIDIFRATSTITTALSQQIPAILPTADLETCRSYQNQDFFLAGERNGIKPDDFDFGNSPLSYLTNTSFKKVAMTTTNGTLAIDKSKQAKKIIIGSFLNLETVSKYLSQQQENTLLFCAGWRGMPNLEDTLFAGAILNRIGNEFEFANDNCFMAKEIYETHQKDLLTFLSTANHYQRLQKLGHEADIEFCLTINKYDILPVLKGKYIVAESLN